MLPIIELRVAALAAVALAAPIAAQTDAAAKAKPDPAIAASTKALLPAAATAAQSIAVCGVTVLVSMIRSGRLSHAINTVVTATETSGCGNDKTTTFTAAAKFSN